MAPTKNQIRAIHTLKGALKMNDESYRDVLSSFNARSSLDLSFDKAKELIELLSSRASAAGLWVPRRKQKTALPFEELGNRPGFASPAQLRKVCAMWDQVSRVESADRRKALESLLARQYRIEKLEWLPEHLVGKVVKTLSIMQKQKEAHDVAGN